MCDLKRAQTRCEGYENLTGGPKTRMCYKDLHRAAKEGLERSAYTYHRILKVMAPVTFGFNRQKGLVLMGSHYFQMVKKRLDSNNCFRQADT